MCKKPSPNQMIVLERLMGTVAAESCMTIQQFADVATSNKHVESWAITPLKALEKMKMVERTPKKVGKALTWRITASGVEAVIQHRMGS